MSHQEYQKGSTDLSPVATPNFTPTYDALQYQAYGKLYIRRLYDVDPEYIAILCNEGLDIPKGWEIRATGSSLAEHCLVAIKQVGKVPGKCPGGLGLGLRHRFLYGIFPAFQVKVAKADVGYVVKDYWK